MGARHSEQHQVDLMVTAGEGRYREARKVTLVGAVINVVLSVAKVVFGVIGHSQALVADGIHSFSDLISDVMVVYAARHGSAEADDEHPYGHARIETAVTVGLGLLLIAVAVGIMIDAVHRLFAPDRLLQPGMLAMLIALTSILSKEGLYHYTMVVARRLRSNLLKANAWHHRSDAISSVVVMVGIGGTMAGLPYLDAVAAVIVAVMVAKVGWDLGWHAIRELIDTGLEQERVEAIRAAILAVDGVKALHQLRTRRMGSHALVDVHILVDPRLSVSEGHHIGEKVYERLARDVDEVSDVTVHIDPEDDEVSAPSGHLPLRGEMLMRLRGLWQGVPGAEHIEDVTLHYLNGEVHVEVWVAFHALASLGEVERLSKAIALAIAADEHVAKVDVLFHC